MSKLFLVGDIGGTNTNLALACLDDTGIELIDKARFSTQQEKSLSEPIQRFLKSARERGFAGSLDFCCISGAGPVEPDETIQLTNAPWNIKASEIEQLLKVPVKLINDFTALSYAVTLLDARDTATVTQLPHSNGSYCVPQDGLMLVIGAGTGLGVGVWSIGGQGNVTAYPSEGGHSELPVFDALSAAFHTFLTRRYGYAAGAELGISGQGIANIFEFLNSESFHAGMVTEDYGFSPGTFGNGISTAAKAILALPRGEWPAKLAQHAAHDPWAGLTMELFVRLYALKAANLVSIFLPRGGVWLAGGISSKNETWLLEICDLCDGLKKTMPRIFADFFCKHQFSSSKTITYRSLALRLQRHNSPLFLKIKGMRLCSGYRSLSSHE